MVRRVVLVAVGEHQPHIRSKLISILVLTAVHLFLERERESSDRDQSHTPKTTPPHKRPHPLPTAYLDGAKVHGFLDDVMVVVEVEGCGVHRLQKGPGISLEDGLTLTQAQSIHVPD